MNDEEFAREQPNVTEDKLNEIVELGSQLVNLQWQVNKIEQLLEAKQKELETLQRFTLPEAMEAIGMTQFRLTNGHTISVDDVFKLSYDKEKIEDIDRWLNRHGHAGLVKRRLVVTIPRGEPNEKASPIVDAIKKSGYELVDDKTIHWQTLNKWGRECNEQGEVIPDDLFNIYSGKIAKVT